MSTWVLLRGLTRESRHWGSLPERLRAQWPQAPVIALDLPGNGELNTMRSPTTVRAMADQARAALRQRGFAPPYHLLAMSLGAMVAISWAVDHPDELAGAVLINTSAGRALPFHWRLKPRAWAPLLRIALPGVSAAQRELAVLRLTSHRHANALAAPVDWIAYRNTHPVARRNALRQLLAALRFTLPRQPPAVPLLVLSGARDRLVDPRCSQRLAGLWRCAHAEHPDAGHDLALDDGDWVVRQIEAWQSGSRAGL